MLDKRIVKVCALLLAGLLTSGCQEFDPAVEEWPHAAVGVLDADISRDGQAALVSSVNFGASYWDLENNQLKFQWKHDDNPQSGITAVDISPDGRRAITVAEDTFVIWNTRSGKAYGYWQAPATITAVALSDLGRYVLLGLKSGKVIHIDMSTGRRLEFLGHGGQAVSSVDLSPNGAWALSGGNDYRAILWSTKSGQPRQLFEHETRVVEVSLGPDGERVFTAGTLGNATVWDIPSGEPLAKLALKQREYVITAARFSNDASLLVTGAPNRDVSLWDATNGTRIKQWRARTRQQGKPSGAIVYAAAFSESGDFILTESSAGFGEKWSINK